MFGILLAFKPCFPENIFSYAMTYSKLVRYSFVNKDEIFIVFSLTWSIQNLTSPAGSPLNFIAEIQTATSYTSDCLTDSLLFSNYLCFLFLQCCYLINVSVYILHISYLFYKTVLFCMTQWVTRSLTILMITWGNHHTYKYLKLIAVVQL